MPALYELDGPDVVRVFYLQTGTVMLGRDRTNQIVLNDPGVSRFHSRVTLRGSRTFIEDLATKNGTWISGNRISDSTALTSGTRIQVGSQVLVYWAELTPDPTLLASTPAIPTEIPATRKVLPPDTSFKFRFWWRFESHGFGFGWRIRRT